jgi:cysteinyl-tRNA synthetase
MQLTNTLTRNKESFKPMKEEKAKVYYCGPTPYNYAHIGNLRTYLFSDMIVKTLKFMGFKIETTMNITDIDDKTIKESIAKNIALREFTQEYIDYFFEDLAKLKIVKADNVSRISDLIDVMAEIIN